MDAHRNDLAIYGCGWRHRGGVAAGDRIDIAGPVALACCHPPHRAACLAALDLVLGVGRSLSRFDPATVKTPAALVFGRLEALRLNTGSSRGLAEGGHWRAARGSLKQVEKVFDGLYEPLGVERTPGPTQTAPVSPGN